MPLDSLESKAPITIDKVLRPETKLKDPLIFSPERDIPASAWKAMTDFNKVKQTESLDFIGLTAFLAKGTKYEFTPNEQNPLKNRRVKENVRNTNAIVSDERILQMQYYYKFLESSPLATIYQQRKGMGEAYISTWTYPLDLETDDTRLLRNCDTAFKALVTYPDLLEVSRVEVESPEKEYAQIVEYYKDKAPIFLSTLGDPIWYGRVVQMAVLTKLFFPDKPPLIDSSDPILSQTKELALQEFNRGSAHYQQALDMWLALYYLSAKEIKVERDMLVPIKPPPVTPIEKEPLPTQRKF